MVASLATTARIHCYRSTGGTAWLPCWTEYRAYKNGAITDPERGGIFASIAELYNVLAVDMAAFDLYLIGQKLAYSTPALLADATAIFPKSIRAVMTSQIVYEVQQAGNCLLYEAF